MRRFFLALCLTASISSTMAAAKEKLLYRNPLNSTTDVAGWVAEGPVNATAVDGALELSGAGGINDHFVFWAPEVFPDGIRISWEFSPRNEPGLAMFFFGAKSVAGGSIFDPSLAPRNGSYPQYHSGDIRVLHASYFRRRWPEERAFLLANLRKSPGFNLVAQGADPLPPVADAQGAFYRITVVKDKREVHFFINDLPIFSFDDDKSTGPVVRDGRIAFRGMTPLVARYRNLEVWKL
ncbi:YesU protein [Bisporella sp. PMI_857]|nr:YesU protein [Bisporella sp. PMI_857]